MSRSSLCKLGCFTIGAVAIASHSFAQQIYKQVDKNGKVTYTDSAPKKYDDPDKPKSVAVPISKDANVVDSFKAPAKSVNSETAKTNTTAALVKKREDARGNLQSEIDRAREALADAKAERDAGQNVADGESQFIKGGSGGTTRQLPKPEYYERLKALDEAVKKAEENLSRTEQNYQRNAPN